MRTIASFLVVTVDGYYVVGLKVTEDADIQIRQRAAHLSTCHAASFGVIQE